MHCRYGQSFLTSSFDAQGEDLLMLTGGSIARAVDITAAVLEDPGSVSAHHSAASTAALSAGDTWSAGASWGGDAQTAAIIVLCDLTSPAALLPHGSDASLAKLSSQYATGMGTLTKSLLRTKVLIRIAGVLNVWLQQALSSIDRFGVEVGGMDWADPAHLSTLCSVNLCISIASITATHTAKFRSHLVQESNFLQSVVIPYVRVLAAWIQWAHDRTIAAQSGTDDAEDAHTAAEAAEVLVEGLQALNQSLRLLVWCSFRTKAARAIIPASPCLACLMENSAVLEAPAVLALACKLAVNCDVLKATSDNHSSNTREALLSPVLASVDRMAPLDKASLGRKVQAPSAEAPVVFGGNDTFDAFRFLFELPTEDSAAKVLNRVASAAHVAALPSVNGPGTLSPLKPGAAGSDSDSEPELGARSLATEEAYKAEVDAVDPDAFPTEDNTVPGLTATSIFQKFGNAAPAAGLSAIPLMPEPGSDSDEAEQKQEHAAAAPADSHGALSPASHNSAAEESFDESSFGVVPTASGVGGSAPAVSTTQPIRPLSRALQRTSHALPMSPVRARGGALGALPALNPAGTSLVGGGGAAGTPPPSKPHRSKAERAERRRKKELRRRKRAAAPQHLCAITGQPLEDPVRLHSEGSGGQVYERSALLDKLAADGKRAAAGEIVVAEDIAQLLQQEQLARLLAR